MAVVVQANLVQLKRAGLKRFGDEASIEGIFVPSPGAVRHFREALIPRETIGGYGSEELLLRLHELWGRYCMMCWVHETGATDPKVNFGRFGDDVTLRCRSVLDAKRAEVHALLWRLRFEQRLRHDAGLPNDPHYDRLSALAKRIPAVAGDQPVADAADGEIVLAACRHAGMLGTVRWVLDPTTTWDDPALMQVAELPF